jgi:hypothetical protein
VLLTLHPHFFLLLCMQAMLTVILGDPEASQQPPSTAQQQAPTGMQAASTQLCSSGSISSAVQWLLLLLPVLR